ncbi:hypothetical protein [Sinomonas soli]
MSGDGAGGAARDPSTFTVTGGEAFRVNTEALEEAAASLAAAASFADALAARLESARGAAWRGACAGSPAAAAFDSRAAELVGRAMRAALDLRGAKEGVAAAEAGYLAAEGRAAARTGVLPWATGALVAGLGSPGSLLGIPPGTFGPPGRTGAAAVRGLASVMPALPLVGPWAAPWVPAGTGRDPIGVTRTEVAAGSTDASTFAYAGESLRKAQGAAPLEDGTPVPPSSLLVERIPRGDGSTAVVVTVPGTQSWSPDDPGGGVFDIEGNLDGMAGGDSHARQLIEHALADQKLGAGDSLVFNAHSQGSLHVLGLLEDEDFRSRYPVAAVTLLGGVPSGFRMPDDVAVLAVSNENDVVPSLSGMRPASQPNVVAVRTPPADGDWGPIAAHDVTRYAADARALDASQDPSVRGYALMLGATIGTGVIGAAGAAGAGRRRERFIYTGTDPKVPQAPWAPRAPSSGPG